MADSFAVDDWDNSLFCFGSALQRPWWKNGSDRFHHYVTGPLASEFRLIHHLMTVFVSVLGAQITFFLVHEKRFSTVRASSAATLVFALLTGFFATDFVLSLQAAFFGSTFVGMTSNSRMGRKRVFLASLLFAAVFICVLPSLKGLGGGLGTAAFVSSTTVYFVEKAIRKRLKSGPPSSQNSPK